jgi:hypothetical protein
MEMINSDRSAFITLGGQEYELMLTTLATKSIARRYGGLENLGEKLAGSEHFEDALDEIVWLITLLANQSILIYNLWNETKKTASDGRSGGAFDLALRSRRIQNRHHDRNVQRGEARSGKRSVKKHGSRVTDNEVFARLIFYGVSLLHRSEREVWLMPLGHLLDQIEIYKQFHGLARPKREAMIDEVIPAGLE